MNESKGVFSSLYRRGGTNLFVLNKQKSLEIKALFYKAISINYYDHEKDKRSHVSINNLVMIDSEIPSSLFCLRGSRTNRTLVRATGEDHSFADNFSEAEIILLAKDGQAKIAVGNFFGAVFAPIFFESTLWAEKRSEFFGP